MFEYLIVFLSLSIAESTSMWLLLTSLLNVFRISLLFLFLYLNILLCFISIFHSSPYIHLWFYLDSFFFVGAPDAAVAVWLLRCNFYITFVIFHKNNIPITYGHFSLRKSFVPKRLMFFMFLFSFRMEIYTQHVYVCLVPKHYLHFLFLSLGSSLKLVGFSFLDAECLCGFAIFKWSIHQLHTHTETKNRLQVWFIDSIASHKTRI